MMPWLAITLANNSIAILFVPGARGLGMLGDFYNFHCSFALHIYLITCYILSQYLCQSGKLVAQMCWLLHIFSRPCTASPALQVTELLLSLPSYTPASFKHYCLLSILAFIVSCKLIVPLTFFGSDSLSTYSSHTLFRSLSIILILDLDN